MVVFCLVLMRRTPMCGGGSGASSPAAALLGTAAASPAQYAADRCGTLPLPASSSSGRLTWDSPPRITPAVRHSLERR
jgi:hypothetical protein